MIENNNPNVITGIISRVTKDTRGSGGNITIDPPLLEIKGDAQISTENRGDGIGGNIDIFAGILKLENQAEITSETFQATGGNISLNLGQYLFLQGGSNITTTAGKAISGGGNGGNITINSPFIIAIPNQDNNIIAEAFAGNGGNININSIALFGIRFTGENIPIRNDISASSQFGLNGTVIINTPDVDPTSGLIQLPLDTVSPTVVNQCQASRQNSFIMLGKGGIPSTPGDTFTDEVIIEDLAEIPLQPSTPQDNNQSSQLEQSQSQPPQIIQAQGWGMTAEGNILLTQSPVTVTPQTPQFNSGNCVQNE